MCFKRGIKHRSAERKVNRGPVVVRICRVVSSHVRLNKRTSMFSDPSSSLMFQVRRFLFQCRSQGRKVSDASHSRPRNLLGLLAN
jgi:hypothetical protein